MITVSLPIFANDRGVAEIHIGVKEFNCIGVLPPHDHPHVYINMGDEVQIRCPYCSTRYRFNGQLDPFQTLPADNLFVEADVVEPDPFLVRLSWPTV